MIIGNQESKNIVQQYMDMFFEQDPKAPHFLIVA